MLFNPIKIKNLEFKNRIFMAPMCMYEAKDGFASDWHLVHYLTRAIGGVGAIIVEATGVEPIGRITENDLGLWSDEQIVKLREIVAKVKENDTLIGIQLNHAGRKSQVNGTIIAPSDIAYPHYQKPKAMDEDDIKRVINQFKEAAERANKADFDFIEIHAAHGYLISQFLSPITNHRHDAYGGNINNRARFLKEVIKAVRLSWPHEKALIVRVTAEDYLEEGNHPSDLATIINLVKSEGIDIIDVSSGGITNISVPSYPGYQLPFAKIIKDETNLPVIGGGELSNPLMMEDVLVNNQVDFLYLGRELLRNPYFVLNSSTLLKADISWPKQYLRAKQ